MPTNENVEGFEQVPGADEEPTEENTRPANKRPPKPKDEAVHAPRAARPEAPSGRNLTFESIAATMRARKASELSKVPEEETVKIALPKLDPKTNKPLRDGLGYLVIEERTVLKRDKVAKDWDERIQKFADKHNVQL